MVIVLASYVLYSSILQLANGQCIINYDIKINIHSQLHLNTTVVACIIHTASILP